MHAENAEHERSWLRNSHTEPGNYSKNSRVENKYKSHGKLDKETMLTCDLAK
jgi:hypothetical protein